MIPNLQLGAVGSPGFPLFVTQQPSKDLSAWALWNRFDELNTTLEPLVLGFVIADVLDNLCCHLLVAARGHGKRFYNKSLRNFAISLVWDGYYGAVIHCRVSKQMSLELGRRNLVALAQRSASTMHQQTENLGDGQLP